jgi:hypothetical protein
VSELLSAAKDSPFALAALITLGAVVWAVEKLGSLNGPMTRMWTAWQNRELNRLRREAVYRAERRRIAADEESGRVADLARQVADLRAEVNWLTGENNEHKRRERLRDTYERRHVDYTLRLWRAARDAGVAFVEPPSPPDLTPMFVRPEDLPPRERADATAK